MTNIEQIRETYHITDEAFTKIMDLMDEARGAIDRGEEYSHFTFERKMKQLVVPPEAEPEYDHHMAENIADAFLKDGKWEEVFLTLYKDDPAHKTYIENWYAEKYGDPQK